ncbi:MAG: flagellar basal body L-ring protein FlgH [Pseudomonadota bacterium]
MARNSATLIGSMLALVACTDLSEVGKVPAMTPIQSGIEHQAMLTPAPQNVAADHPDNLSAASLWSGGRQSLLGDRRASERGDILTVVIEIDDRAEFQNSTSRGRTGTESLSIPQLFGIPQRLDDRLPQGASGTNPVSTNSSSNATGNGSVQRNERLTLRIAATVVDMLQNGVLQIQGSQEVRVNFEVRELLVSGYVRPEDISRQNEITYDKIASARVSYGGRGQITDVQQPRYGQQIADIVLPF